jgi:repressor LexA
MAKGLTSRQQEIFDFVVAYVNTEGYPPSIREIGSQFNIGSLRGVTVHLDALERKNYISRSNTPRSIKVIHPKYIPSSSKSVMVPILGSIAAGAPILADEEHSDTISVPSDMVRGIDKPFLLKVKGDSMTGDGIFARDLVLIRPQSEFNAHDIMAIRVGEEATIKRIRRSGPKLELLSSNPSHAPREVDAEDSEVIGRVVGLFRDYEGRSF